ncbi:Retrovirus-related Pol polyprotein from transposon 297 [Anthophora retusa]
MAISAEQLEQLIRRLSPRNAEKHFTHCPARFNGTRTKEAVDDFLASADFFRSSEGIKDENAVKGLTLLLQGPAHTWWIGIKDSITTWKEAQAAIRNEFAPSPPAYQIYQQVFATNQDSQTPTRLFVSDKRALLAQVNPPDMEARQLDLIYGLLHLRIRERVPRKTVQDFKQSLLDAAREVEATFRERENIRAEAQGERLDAESSKSKIRKNKTRVKCAFCKNPGHDITVCRKKDKVEQEAKEKGLKETSQNGIQCYGCGKQGVIRRNCPTCALSSQAAPTISQSFNAVNVEAAERPAVDITVAGVLGTAFLDSGAKTSLASPRLYKLLRERNFSFIKKIAKVTLADGRAQQKLIYTTVVPVTLKGRTFTTPFIYTDGGSEAVTLVRIDFARLAGLVVNYRNDTYYFHGARHEVYHFIRKETMISYQIRNLNADQTEPMEVDTAVGHNNTTVNIDNLMKSDEWSNMVNNYGPIISPLPQTPQEPTPLKLHGLPNPVTTSRSEFQWYDAIQAVSEGYEDGFQRDTDLFPSMEFASLNLRDEDEGNALTIDQQRQMNQLIVEYKDRFAEHGPPTLFAEHRIDTGSNAVVASPPYRISPSKHEILKAEVQDLLKLEIIEECESAWASPAVLVPKPGGQARLCIDYRKLNAITTPCVYPLPRVDDLQATGGCTFISTLDLKAGYYQVKVADDDQDKTAFITSFGLFRFKRLPFGLRNAPATFQRLINRFKTRLGHVIILAYLDDIIILSPTAEKHMGDLRDVFERLRHFELRMNRPKCRFACRSVKYLGHIVSPRGIHTDPEKVRAIQELAVPKNVKHVLTFLQTCSCYRKFIADFANIARPLSDLTNKNVEFRWGKEQSEAFEKLKAALISAPILQQADPAKGYTLRTDASSYAIGAALIQGEGHDERLIEYASRLLVPVGRNYSTTEREALAIVWAVQNFGHI